MLENGCRYTALENQKLIIEVFVGIINFDDFLEAKSKELAEINLDDYDKFFVDLRRAKIKVNDGDLYKIFEYFKNHESMFSGKRAALLISNPEQTVKAIITGSYEIDSSFKSGVFSTVEAALLFLDIHVVNRQLIEDNIINLIEKNA